MNFFSLFRALDLAGTETTGALSLLLLADLDNVDLEVVELNINMLDECNPTRNIAQ